VGQDLLEHLGRGLGSGPEQHLPESQERDVLLLQFPREELRVFSAALKNLRSSRSAALAEA
jgi:hypothetical protein